MYIKLAKANFIAIYLDTQRIQTVTNGNFTGFYIAVGILEPHNQAGGRENVIDYAERFWAFQRLMNEGDSKPLPAAEVSSFAPRIVSLG